MLKKGQGQAVPAPFSSDQSCPAGDPAQPITREKTCITQTSRTNTQEPPSSRLLCQSHTQRISCSLPSLHPKNPPLYHFMVHSASPCLRTFCLPQGGALRTGTAADFFLCLQRPHRAQFRVSAPDPAAEDASGGCPKPEIPQQTKRGCFTSSSPSPLN